MDNEDDQIITPVALKAWSASYMDLLSRISRISSCIKPTSSVQAIGELATTVSETGAGILSAKAVDLAKKVVDEKERGECYKTLLTFFQDEPQLLSDIVDFAAKIMDERVRADILIVVPRCRAGINTPLRRKLFSEVMAIGDKEVRADALIKLMPMLKGETALIYDLVSSIDDFQVQTQREKLVVAVLIDALEDCEQLYPQLLNLIIRFKSEMSKARALCWLASCLHKDSPAREEILALVCSLKSDEARDYAISNLDMTHDPGHVHAEDSLDIVKSIKNDFTRVWALIRIAHNAPPDLKKDQLLEWIAKDLEKMPKPRDDKGKSTWARYLNTLANELVDEKRHSLKLEALAWVKKIHLERERADALSLLAITVGGIPGIHNEDDVLLELLTTALALPTMSYFTGVMESIISWQIGSDHEMGIILDFAENTEDVERAITILKTLKSYVAEDHELQKRIICSLGQIQEQDSPEQTVNKFLDRLQHGQREREAFSIDNINQALSDEEGIYHFQEYIYALSGNEPKQVFIRLLDVISADENNSNRQDLLTAVVPNLEAHPSLWQRSSEMVCHLPDGEFEETVGHLLRIGKLPKVMVVQMWNHWISRPSFSGEHMLRSVGVLAQLILTISDEEQLVVRLADVTAGI